MTADRSRQKEKMEEKQHCFINDMEVTVVDGKCTEDCSIEDCVLFDPHDETKKQEEEQH